MRELYMKYNGEKLKLLFDVSAHQVSNFNKVKILCIKYDFFRVFELKD